MKAKKRGEPRVKVDWNELRRKLDGVGASLSETMHATPAQAARILQERAQRLREVTSAVRVMRATVEVLAFERRQERYAIELSTLHSVQPFAKPARVAGAPSFVYGVVNVRGEIIAVTDLAAYLGVESDGEQHPEHLVVAQVRPSDATGGHAESVYVALPADRITGILPADSAILTPPLHTFSERKRRLVRGLLPDGTLLLNLGDSFALNSKEM